MRRASPAMMIALVALLLALAGTGNAPRHAFITSKDVRNNSLTGADIRNSSLRRGSARGS